MHASNHTELINKFIGLCMSDPEWPRTLYDLGYRVQLVEQKISLPESTPAHPDVVAVSQTLRHAIVADCKGGSHIETNQDHKYANLHARDLTHVVEIHDPNQLKHDACYVIDIKSYGSLKDHTELPFIMFGDQSITTCKKFNLNELNQSLSSAPIAVDSEPVSYYPFSPGDNDAFIIPHVLRGLLIHMSDRKHTDPNIADLDIMAYIPHYRYLKKAVAIKHQKALQKKAREIIDRLRKDRKLDEQLRKLEEEYNPQILEALRRTCASIIEQHERQSRLTDKD